MPVNLLAQTSENFKGLPNIFWGVFTFVLGLVIVFVGMALLVLCVSAVAKAFGRKEEKAVSEQVDEEELEAQPVIISDEAEVTDEKVRVAVIAAVLAYLDEGGTAKNEFVVRKIKKLNR